MKIKIERQKDPDDMDWEDIVLVLEEVDTPIVDRVFGLIIGSDLPEHGGHPKVSRELMTRASLKDSCDADIEEGWGWAIFSWGSLEIIDRTIKARCYAKDDNPSGDWIHMIPIAKMILA